MLKSLMEIDQELFLFLNHLHNDSLDTVMLFLSHSYIPGIIILCFMLFYGYRKMKFSILLAILFSFLTVGLTDGISSRFFKPTFKRLRPCHEPALKEEVYTASKKCWGGKYGFLSSHAANTFGIAMFVWLLFTPYTKKTFILFLWAGLVSYSRIYLAKHYPLDIFCGALLGLFCAWISHQFFKVCVLKLKLLYQVR